MLAPLINAFGRLKFGKRTLPCATVYDMDSMSGQVGQLATHLKYAQGILAEAHHNTVRTAPGKGKLSPALQRLTTHSGADIHYIAAWCKVTKGSCLRQRGNRKHHRQNE